MKWMRTGGSPILGNHHIMIYTAGVLLMVYDYHGFYYEGVTLMDCDISKCYFGKYNPQANHQPTIINQQLYPQTYPHI